MFHRPKKVLSSGLTKSLKDLTKIVPVGQFFADTKRQVLLKKIQTYIQLDESRYESLCTLLMDNLVHYCQSLPETSHSFYAQAGGLVDHALNRTDAALELFQEFAVLDEGAQAYSEVQQLWQYALFSAAILQGIGKLCVDYKVNLYDQNGQLFKLWNPLHESFTPAGYSYDYELLPESEVDFRRRLNLLLAKTLMPVSGFNWIAADARVLTVWLALLHEDLRGAGTLGAILIRADAIAIQRYYNELALGLAASRNSPLGRASTFSGGVPDSLIEKEQAVGMEFIQWLSKGLTEGIIMINKAPLLSVPGGILMSKEMFQLFVREHPEYKNWMAVKNGFMALGIHDKALTNEAQDAVVVANCAAIMPKEVQVHYPAAGKQESMSATAVVHKMLQGQLSQPGGLPQKLEASGQWLKAESDIPASAFGASHRG